MHRATVGQRAGRAVALVAAAGLLATPAVAQRGVRAADATPDRAADGDPVAIGGGSGLAVGGIEVDTRGRNDHEARLAGWREAQRLAWPQLWARMSGQPESAAPRLGDSALDGIVSAIEVEREQLGGGRYIARIAVIFDRARAATHLGRFAALASSPPFLVIPVLQDAATRMGHEPGSPWLAAWQRLRAGESPIDYVRIQPTPGDVALLSAWSAERRNVRFWRALVDRYAVADVVIPELVLERSWAGGPVSALLITRFGPAGRELGRVRLQNRAGDVAALMDEAVRQADRLYVAALRAGNLLPDPKLIEPQAPTVLPVESGQFGDPGGGPGTGQQAAGIRVRVASPDDATLAAIERALRGTPGVSAVRTVSYVLGGESTLDIVAAIPLDSLRLALDGQGLRLVDEPAGRLLRRRLPDEAPLAPPPPPAGEGLPAGDSLP